MNYKDFFSFENVTKIMGDINKAVYGVNPFANGVNPFAELKPLIPTVQNEEEPSDEDLVREGEKVEETND